MRENTTGKKQLGQDNEEQSQDTHSTPSRKFYGGVVGESSEEAYARLRPIVNGISYKYAATNPFIDQEDLANDLWVKLLSSAEGILKYTETPEEYKCALSCLSNSLAATICHRYAADRYRYHRLRRDSNQTLILEMESDDDPDNESTEICSCYSSKTNEADGVVFMMMLHQIIDNCTEPGTKARKWLVSKFYYEGLLTDETLRESDRADLMVVDDPSTETGYVLALGYKSPRPGSWGATIWELRQSICKYLWGSKFTEGTRWDEFEKSFDF